MVFVLLPGGDAWMGAQSADPQSKRHDPAAQKTEAPWRAELGPFFIAAHEVTQGQWLRMEGGMPSLCATGRQLNPDPRVTRSHPVESVDAHESAHRLELFGLSLPTEAQWEYAARGGSDAVFVFGDEAAALAGCANAKRGGGDDPRDLYARTAPVGVFAPNAYGLYDVLGNVEEWCADAISDSQDRPSVEPRTGLREPQRPRDRVVRGRSYDTTPDQLRASARRGVHPSNADRFVGVRPVRNLE
jgi:formylglycine-generating enzyme required for sulfatase activity